MQDAAEIDMTRRHRADCGQIRIGQIRSPVCRLVGHRLQHLRIPGHHQICEQCDRTRNGALFLATATSLTTVQERVAGLMGVGFRAGWADLGGDRRKVIVRFLATIAQDLLAGGANENIQDRVLAGSGYLGNWLVRALQLRATMSVIAEDDVAMACSALIGSQERAPDFNWDING